MVDDFGDLDAFGPGDGSGEAVGYAGTGEGTYDSASDSYTMPSVSNISNSDSYDPTFAAQSKLSQGLDPRGLQGFNTTAFNNPQFLSQYGSDYNPLEQLNESQQANILNAMTSASSYEKNPNLRNAFIDTYKSDPMSFIENVKAGKISSDEAGQVFGSLGINLDRPCGDSTFSLFGKEANYPMDSKNLAELGVTALNYNLAGKDPTRFSENPFTTVKRGLQDAGIAALQGAKDFILNPTGGESVENFFSDLFSSTDQAKENILPQSVQDAINSNQSINASTGLPVGQKSYFDQLRESGQIENSNLLQDLARANNSVPGGIFSEFETPVLNTDILPFRTMTNIEGPLPGKNIISTRNDGQITNKFRASDGSRLNTTVGNLAGSDKSFNLDFTNPDGFSFNTGDILNKYDGPRADFQGENLNANIDLGQRGNPRFSGSYTIPTENYGDFKINTRGTDLNPSNVGLNYSRPGPFGIGEFTAGVNQGIDSLNFRGKPNINAQYGFTKRF